MGICIGFLSHLKNMKVTLEKILVKERTWDCRGAWEHGGWLQRRLEARGEEKKMNVRWWMALDKTWTTGQMLESFWKFNYEAFDKISNLPKNFSKSLHPSSKFDPKNVWVICILLHVNSVCRLLRVNSVGRSQEHFKKLTPISKEELNDTEPTESKAKLASWCEIHLN